MLEMSWGQGDGFGGNHLNGGPEIVGVETKARETKAK